MTSTIGAFEVSDSSDDKPVAAAWGAAAIAKARPLTSGRLSRYRKLNHAASMIVAEGASQDEIASAAQLLLEAPAMASNRSFVARESSSRRRDDVGGDLRKSPLLYIVAFTIPEGSGHLLDDWYENEHMEMLQRCPTWVWTRRLHIGAPESGAWGTHLAFHYLTDIRALTSPELAVARDTPWRQKLGKHSWCRSTGRLYLREPD